MEGKVALVTGSTSGIGLGIAVELLKNGCQLILTGSRSEENAASAIKEAKSSGSVVHYIQSDLSCQVESLCNEVDQLYPGGIDILVNNAGINFVKNIDEYPVETWDKLIAINLTAPFKLTRHFLPKMKSKGWGRIINISSVQGTISAPGKAPYATTKHGIIGLTKGVALEVATQGITVNAISPAWVDTPSQRPYAFFATLSSDLKNIGNTEIVIYDVVPLNVGGTYSGTTGKFTCQEDGLYTFSWTSLSKPKEEFTSVLTINNKDVAANVVDNEKVEDSLSGSSTVVVRLNKTDQVWIRGYAPDGDYLDAKWGGYNVPASTFSGFKIN